MSNYWREGCSDTYSVACILGPSNWVYQLASLSLLASLLFSDLLYLRFALFMGFLLLLLWSLLGLPSWGSTFGIGIPPDSVFYSFLNSFAQGYLFFRMLWESRPINFKSEREAGFWRACWRRAGISRFDFLEVLKAGEWKEYAAGQVIQQEAATGSPEYLHFQFSGLSWVVPRGRPESRSPALLARADSETAVIAAAALIGAPLPDEFLKPVSEQGDAFGMNRSSFGGRESGGLSGGSSDVSAGGASSFPAGGGGATGAENGAAAGAGAGGGSVSGTQAVAGDATKDGSGMRGDRAAAAPADAAAARRSVSGESGGGGGGVSNGNGVPPLQGSRHRTSGSEGWRTPPIHEIVYPIELFQHSLGRKFGMYLRSDPPCKVVACTHVVLYRWKVETIERLTSSSSNIANTFRALVSSSVLNEFQRLRRQAVLACAAAEAAAATAAAAAPLPAPAANIGLGQQNVGYGSVAQNRYYWAAPGDAGALGDERQALNGANVAPLDEFSGGGGGEQWFYEGPANRTTQCRRSLLSESSSRPLYALWTNEADTRPLESWEDDNNAWTLRDFWKVVWNALQNPIKHHRGIRFRTVPPKWRGPALEERIASIEATKKLVARSGAAAMPEDMTGIFLRSEATEAAAGGLVTPSASGFVASAGEGQQQPATAAAAAAAVGLGSGSGAASAGMGGGEAISIVTGP